jgi:hypothetical protein
MAISAVSLSAVSEMAMVPDSECRMPTLMVSAATAGWVTKPAAASAMVTAVALTKLRRCMVTPFDG